MSVILPFVGYVAAAQHGQTRDLPVNFRNFSLIDGFVGQLRLSVHNGWSQNVYQSRSQSGELDDKNFRHDVFFEKDLDRRPELRRLIDYLTSQPAGGVICVINLDHLTKASSDKYLEEQCKALSDIVDLNIPVVEATNGQAIGMATKLSSAKDKNAIIGLFKDIVDDALIARNTIAAGYDKTKKRCSIRDKKISDKTNWPEFYSLMRRDLLCKECKQKCNALPAA